MVREMGEHFGPEERVSDNELGDESERDEDFIDGARDEVLAEAEDDAYQSPDYSGKPVQEVRIQSQLQKT